MCQLRTKSEACGDVLENMANKLFGWRQKKTLSIEGRLTLAKVVAETIPSYIMQVIILLKKMLAKMDKKHKDFFMEQQTG